MKKVQAGFSILEILIALSIGLFVIGGVLSIFVGVKTTTTDTASYGELQENARFAINSIKKDLSKQGFLGDFVEVLSDDILGEVIDAPSGDCTGGGANNSTFPIDSDEQFRTLWGETVTNQSILGGCITDAKLGSDVIQVKRVLARPYTRIVDNTTTPVTLGAATTVTTGVYYFVATDRTAQIFKSATVPTLPNSRVWQYQHHIYYVKEDTHGQETIPVLMKSSLNSGGTKELLFSPVVDGIEMIRFMYGIDTDADGIVNTFISAGNMNDDYWDNDANSELIAVRVFVLARVSKEDAQYKNENTYQLGDFPYTVNDGYRRLLLSTTVSLHNSVIDSKS